MRSSGSRASLSPLSLAPQGNGFEHREKIQPLDFSLERPDLGETRPNRIKEISDDAMFPLLPLRQKRDGSLGKAPGASSKALKNRA